MQEAVVVTKLHDFWHERVMRTVRGLDPRTPGVSHARTCKYVAWSGILSGCKLYHKYVYACLPARLHACMARFRLGCWTSLAVHSAILNRGRSNPSTPPPTHCRFCGSGTFEDEKHVVFECMHLAHLRTKYAGLFSPTGPGAHGDMPNWLCGNKPLLVASFLWEAHCFFMPCSP